MLDPTRIKETANKTWSQPEKQPDVQRSAIDDLRDGGTLSHTLPGYRERGPQLEMARLVEEAIEQDVPALIEAATGTGKSLSYLIPVIRSGKKAIISTANKALQEQLYQKDIPFCQQHIQSFDATLLKGKNNYLCLQRFDREINEGMQAYVQDPIFERLTDAMAAVGKKTWNGDFESLSFTVPGDIRARITVDDNECARRKCPLFQTCYYYQAREQAKHAQIIVTNHDLLLLDAQSQSKLLPSHDIVIVDEAHVLEDVATKQFTVEIRASQILALLTHPRLKTHTQEKTRDQARQQAEALWAHLDSIQPGNGRIALHTTILPALTLARTIEDLSNQLTNSKPMIMTSEDEELHTRTITRCNTLASDLQAVFSVDSKEHVYYLERVQNHPVTASMTPLDVAPALRDSLFTQDTTICCSATLSTPGQAQEAANFTYFQEQVGLDHPDLISAILPPVFDYRSNALLYLPHDLPEPAYGSSTQAIAYEQALAKRMLNLAEAAQGRAFLLFSSRRILNSVAEHIAPDLIENDYTILTQGDMPIPELIRQFRISPKAVLFGLKTFWEGVDVQGDALSLVVIDKLPFPPIDDPVIAAKLKYIEATGENAFSSYSLPSITLTLKQGVGRLIRSSSDRGVMAILDTRLHTKSYGKRILACLPPARRVSSLEAVQDFFIPMAQEARQFAQARAILLADGLSNHTYAKKMSNGEILQRIQQVINDQARTEEQVTWAQKALRLILQKNGCFEAIKR